MSRIVSLNQKLIKIVKLQWSTQCKHISHPSLFFTAKFASKFLSAWATRVDEFLVFGRLTKVVEFVVFGSGKENGSWQKCWWCNRCPCRPWNYRSPNPAPVLWPADFAALAPSLPVGSLKQTPAPGPAPVVASAEKRKCQFCKFFGTNLERHLLAKHSDKVSSKLRVKRAVFWANDISSESRGEVKGRCNEYAYQCGMRGRGAMVMRKT